jgi:hypothetical protein
LTRRRGAPTSGGGSFELLARLRLSLVDLSERRCDGGRGNAANARFEGSLVLSHEEFIEQKQIDIKLVAGGRYELYSHYPLQIQAVAGSVVVAL